MINLISDTVTKPDKGMLSFMMQAKVGDDVFSEDETVNHLQERVADMFGKEAALFCPSGTMSNQIAIKVNTRPLDDVICDIDSHIYQYETGGYAFNSGVSISLINGNHGKITAHQILDKIKAGHDWQTISKLVVIENTCNKGGGGFYTLDEINPISAFCREKGLRLHLDGARLFNALVETNENTKEWGQQFDTLSICMSKGLGAPIGSLLIGDKELIKEARRFRKVMGGGMRQVGYLAAACIYALDHNIERLKEDNDNAKIIGKTLENLSYVKMIKPVKSNIVIFQLIDSVKDIVFVEMLKKEGILATPFGDNTIRFVTHLDVNNDMINRVNHTLMTLESKF